MRSRLAWIALSATVLTWSARALCDDRFDLVLMGGMNLGTQTVNPTGATYGTAFGGSAGLQFGMLFLPWLGAETGGFFATRNSAYSFVANHLTTSVITSYPNVIIPLDVKFRIFTDALEARTGVYFGIGVVSISTSTTSTNGPPINSTADFPTSNISPFDVGLVEGISYRYCISGIWGVFGEFRYLYGLVNLDTTGQVFQAYRDIQIHAGLDLRF
ncbi:MAG: outer membrane beta-barrel protein [Bdellovibrionota bacterium]